MFRSHVLVPALLIGLPLGGLTLGPQEGEQDETELDRHMEVVEETVKRLRRSIRDPENRAQSLALVTELQAATVASKELVPEMTAGQPEAERVAFVTEYRRMMVDFLEAQVTLERAILDGDVDAAKEAFVAVRDFEDSGHERFTEDEE